MSACVCLKKRTRHRRKENKQKERLEVCNLKLGGGQKHSRKCVRHEKGVINLHGSGLMQVFASPLALFTLEAVRGGEICR